MSYLDKNLLPDERILFRTKKHIIIFFFPLVWTIFAFYASFYMNANPILVTVQWVPALLTVIFWVYVWFEYFFSEFAVTNKRIMMREGFIYRHTNEMRLSTVSQVNIVQSLFGQLFNYGTIIIMGFGASDAFTLIARPFTFQKFVNEEIDKIVR